MARHKAPKPCPITKIDGQLEIDHERGVIYFHPHNTAFAEVFGGLTALRIQGLPSIPVKPKRMLDIRYVQTREYTSEDTDYKYTADTQSGCSWDSPDTADGDDRDANAIHEFGMYLERRMKERMIQKADGLTLLIVKKQDVYSVISGTPQLGRSSLTRDELSSFSFAVSLTPIVLR